MRERYESIGINDLKAIARSRGIKGTSAMKKSQLVEAMLELDAKLAAEEKAGTPSESAETPARRPVAADIPAQRTEVGETPLRRPAAADIPVQRPAAGETPVRRTEAAKAPARQPETTDTQIRRTEAAEASARRAENPAARDVTDPERRTSKKNMHIIDLRSDTYGSRREKVVFPGSGGETATELPPDMRETLSVSGGGVADGILEIMSEGYGFIRCENYLPGENDVYVAPGQIRRFGLKTGDVLLGVTREKSQTDKFAALAQIHKINGYSLEDSARRKNFEDMTPIFPNERLVMERPGGSAAMRMVDIISPVGKGQRGMIVSPPKAGKTTLLKDVAQSIQRNNPGMRLLILLIDERPEEVTDIKEAIQGSNVEVIYSTFDELPDHHRRVAEMTIERAKRLVEHGEDVVILLDSITRLTRAYNLTVSPSGRTLSGGIDPAAFHMPKKFFGAARNMREGGSLTILATALVETGSKMDDVIYEEFKGTGNMELVLNRKLQERRIFPAIDIAKSGTRNEHRLMSEDEFEAVSIMRRAMAAMKTDEAADKILDLFSRTRTNEEFIGMAKKIKFY